MTFVDGRRSPDACRCLATVISCLLACSAATTAAEPRVPEAKISFQHAAPVLSIDGRPQTISHFGVITWPKASRDLYGVTEELLGKSRDNGLHLYMVHLTNWKWQGVGVYDLSIVNQYCNDLLAIDPAATIILGFPLGDPLGGDQMADARPAHRDELVKTEEGKTELGVYPNEPRVECFSLASKFWMQESQNALRSLIAHVKRSAYCDRVIGYLPWAGTSSEWLAWGCEHGEHVDYSRPFCSAWQDWLEGRYATTDALNGAWRTDHKAFSAVSLPTWQERNRPDAAFLFDPSASRRMIDFRRFFSELIAEDIVQLGRVVKEETGGKSLCGVFYGYVAYVHSRYWTEPGHFALGKVLDSPSIDFLMSPSRYDDRGMGGGSGFMTAEASVRLHDKLWITQADMRTHRAEGDGFGRCYTLQESIATMQREFVGALAKDAGCQWFDFSFGWITGDADLMRLVGRLRSIEERLQREPRSAHFDRDRASNSIAVLVDEESTFYSVQNTAYHDLFINGQYAALSRTGVGFDCYLLSDLPKMPPYKVYVFLNALKISPETAGFIDAHLKKDGNVLVWLGLAGITDGQSLEPARASAVTGMNLALHKEERPLQVRVGVNPNSLCKYVTEPLTYGNDSAMGIYFVPTDGEVLGTLADGEAALATKSHTGWTSVYSSAPGLPASLLRGIAEAAGLRIANPSQTDVTYCSGDMLTVHTKLGGPRTFRVSNDKVEAEELLTGVKIPVKEGQFSATLEPVSTAIFRLRE